jgi:oxygen-independent coproporphyrinogen-3 oxidase
VPTVPAALLQHFDTPGLRDTSYPGADHFTAGHGDGAALRALSQRATAAAGRPLAVYVHIPFCESVCHYCACNKVVTPHHSRAADYLDALAQEIELVRAALGGAAPGHPAPALAQLHLGGGTPTFLTDAELHRLLTLLRRAFRIDARTEATIEADPRTATPQRLAQLRRLGFQGISFGIQDLDPQVQLAINRVQPYETVQQAMAGAHELGFTTVNADLICGLPCQTPERFAHTVQRIGGLRPTRVTLHRYVHAPQRFRSQRRIPIVELPDLARCAGMLTAAGTSLLAQGYRWAGMDRFALPEDRAGELPAANGDMIGLGVSAVSRVGASCHQNAGTLADYYEALAAGQLPVVRGLALTGDDIVRRAVVSALLSQGRVEFAAVAQAHGVDVRQDLATEIMQLHPFVEAGAVVIDDQAIGVTPTGWYVVRAIAQVFDRHLQPAEAPAARRPPRRR